VAVLRRVLRSQQAGLLLLIVALTVALALAAGSRVDEATGRTINNFLNSYTLIQTATDASFIAIMAVGATLVIVSGGIDLSVGSMAAFVGCLAVLVLNGSFEAGWPEGTLSRAGRFLWWQQQNQRPRPGSLFVNFTRVA